MKIGQPLRVLVGNRMPILDCWLVSFEGVGLPGQVVTGAQQLARHLLDRSRARPSSVFGHRLPRAQHGTMRNLRDSIPALVDWTAYSCRLRLININHV